MDNFMEKITHKFSATDLIRANSQAEAVEMDYKKEQLMLFEAQMDKVDTALTDIREVNLKNIESAQSVQNLAKASTDGINKTVDESLAKIAEIKEATEVVEAVKELSEKIDTIRKEMEDFAHTDHVKIYRNVQVSFVDELAARTNEIINATKKKGALLPISIITMLASLASLVLVIMHILNLI